MCTTTRRYRASKPQTMSGETKEDSKPLNDTPSNEGVVDKGEVNTSTNFQCVKSIQESSASLLRMVSKVDFHDFISNIISLYHKRWFI